MRGWLRDPATQERALAILSAIGRALARIGSLVGWFILAQAVTMLAMALVVTAAWLLDMRAGMIVCAVCLVVLERKVELDRR